MNIENKLIKINKNHDNRLIKLKYSTILEIILDPNELRTWIELIILKQEGKINDKDKKKISIWTRKVKEEDK